MLIKRISFLITFTLTISALISVIPVSYNTIMQVTPCPSIGMIPACYIVTIGYFLVLVSLFNKKKYFFYLGWSPVFLLAITGSLMEVFGHEICPKNSQGIPMCYFSLLIAVIVFIFYQINKHYSEKVNN